VLTASITGAVTDHVTSFIGSNGVLAVFGLMVLDAVFPAASEIVMLYAGALAAGAFSQSVVLFGHPIDSRPLAFLTMVLAGTIGYTVGSLVGWWVGLFGGRPFLERHGRWFHLSHEQLGRAERWFERFGSWAVLVGRITPVARSFISIPAGVFRGCPRMPSLIFSRKDCPRRGFTPCSPGSSGCAAYAARLAASAL